MRKLIAVAILAALAIAIVPQLASAASTAYIAITATGVEVDISCNATEWAIGNVDSGFTDNTSNHFGSLFKWGRITNSTSEAVEITINGNEMENAGETIIWHLDGDGSPPAADFSMRIGLDDTADGYDVYVKDYDAAPYNKLVYDADDTLDGSGTWDFGLEFVMGTGAGIGNDPMRMSDSAGSPTNDTDDGLCLTASVP